MLQNVRLINYRGLKDTTIPLAPVTLLTGTNGVGKTSVLEGLYFLLSPQMPDAAVFPRYLTQVGFQGNMAAQNGLPFPIIPFRGYDYPSFWNECPTNGISECQVEADIRGLKVSWEMKISDFAVLPPELKTVAAAYGLQSGVGSPYVLWEWTYTGGIRVDGTGYEIPDATLTAKAVQQLCMEPRFSPRIGECIVTTCRYADMSSLKHIPGKLPLQTENLLTDALKIINPSVTGVRLEAGNAPRLCVIMNEESTYSLGTLGIGAEAWASMLLVLAELAGTSAGQTSMMFLADEIGAGIHYSKLGEMWDFILKFLSKYPEIQMVLTTHSRDCISAFCKTFQNAESCMAHRMAHIVRLHKFDEKDGVQPTVYPQATFETILSGEWEVRG